MPLFPDKPQVPKTTLAEALTDILVWTPALNTTHVEWWIWQTMRRTVAFTAFTTEHPLAKDLKFHLSLE